MKSTRAKLTKSLKAKLMLMFSILLAIVLIVIGIIIVTSVTNIVVPLNNDLTEAGCECKSK